ncbi:MAG: hypothetical protein H6607_01475 [Flavobacteriales bacterium]|nr:hypothetical protein [Flavobacteriales bacterium]
MFKAQKNKKASTAIIALIGVLFGFLLDGCKEDQLLENQTPDTHLSIEKINLTGENRLNSSVYITWYGTDVDGRIIGYEFSTDNSNWFFTTRRDSVFRFDIEPGKDTTDIDFYVRSIDDKDARDETPAHLKIPLRNSAPEVHFDDESMPVDTAFSVVTFRWNFNDPDGNHTVIKALLKANNGSWVEIDRSKFMLSIRPQNAKQTGVVSANIYYNTDISKVGATIDGINNNGNNTFYLKVIDFAGTESVADTSESIFVKAQNSDLLLISGQPSNVNQAYGRLVKNSYGSFDAIDFAADNGQYQPKFWNPTFSLLTELYDKLVLNADQSLFTNSITGQSGLLLEFAAPVLQNYNNKGGKSFIITSFPAGYVPTPISGAVPIDSLSTTSGQAVIYRDSSIFSSDATWPTLQPGNNVILGLDPFVPSVDGEAIYQAQISTFGAWKGSNVVGAVRKRNGKINQVFFSVELYLFNKDEAKLNALFDKVLNKEFNW